MPHPHRTSRSSREDSPTVDWHSIQHLLENAVSDVVIILDCCFAASADQRSVDGTIEVLAACARELNTIGVSQWSFTSRLTEVLHDLKKAPFTITELHSRLVNFRAAKGKKKLLRAPVHSIMSNKNRPSICIAPLVEASKSPPADLLPAMNDMQLSNTPNSTIGFASPDHEFKQTRVLIAVSVDDCSSLKPEEWLQWLQSHVPADITGIRIEGFFGSHSTLNLISLPIEIWDLLPENSAYRFVDFVITGNLMRTHNSSSLATHEKESKAIDDSHYLLSKMQKYSSRHSSSKPQDTITPPRPYKGDELESNDNDGRTLLSRAAENGYEAMVKLLLEKGAELETKDKNYGQTPLSWAASNGHEVVVKLLLEEGAKLETKDNNNGRTPLSYAASNGHEAVVKLLLEKGAELETKDKYNNRTPLSWAASNGHEAVVKLLVEKGAELETKSNNGQTPLLYASSNGHEAVVKLLLEEGAELETKVKYNGRTPLSYAASNGHEAVVKLLLEEGAELETKDKYNGRTPLSYAASRGHVAVVKLLLEKGTELETKDKYNGRTPLSWAASNGHEAVVKLLLEKGAEKPQ